MCSSDLASANRDPAAFPEPDAFRLDRAHARHMTFSFGPHYCPGGGLIRMELEEVLTALLDLPSWELAGSVDWGTPNLQDRGPKHLRIHFRNEV